MRVFMVSHYGSSKPLADKLLGEGHDVCMYVTNQTARKLNRLPYVVDTPTSDMMNVELFVIEDDTAGAFTDKARQLGRPTIGGGSFGDRLARNPVFLEKVMTGCELRVAEQSTKGLPVNLGGWFCGESFIRPYFLGIRYLRVGSGNVGKKTKGMGIAGQYKMRGNIFNLLKKLETTLKTAGYQGFVNLQLYINNESAKVSACDLGLAFPNLCLITALHNTMGNFLFKVATGVAKQATVQPDKVGIGVVWLPDIDVSSISPLMVCGSGGDIKEAISTAYKSIHKLSNDDAYYRIDIGQDYGLALDQLKRWDWI